MRRFSRILLQISVGCAVGLAGCASSQSPAQRAVAYRQAFNSALEAVHTLHQQGVIDVAQERQLLPAILAGSAALDRMDADAAAGDQGGFDVAAAAAQAAVAQIQAAARPTRGPSLTPAPATPAGAASRPTGANGG